jgi:S1-C subfamily serine protease
VLKAAGPFHHFSFDLLSDGGNMRSLIWILTTFLVFCVFLVPLSTLAVDGIEPSVVKVIVTKRSPDFFRPWTKAAPEQAAGSGVVIEGKRILTNAHVVLHASQVFVQMRKGGDQLNAKVVGIGPGIDLAVLELADAEKLQNVPAVPLADELPELKSRVTVYGYPTGGDNLSITDGIVSRIEFAGYNFSAGGVRVQVDAALNAGNSGGPAVDDGRIVGLVFSKIAEAENIGYLIPPEEIRAFLDDVEDGKYEGNCLMFDQFQSAENQALRKFLELPENATGIVVTRPYRDDDEYPLQEWDVVTHVGTHAIDNQGYCDVRDGLRMRFMYYVARLAKEGKIELTILWEGEKRVVSVPVSPQRDLLVPILADGYPEYFIYGPLVFTAATQEYVRSLGGNGLGALLVLESPLLARLYRPPSERGEQLVVIATRMFPHPIIKGYDNRPLGVVEKFNGASVKNLRALAEMLRDCDDEFVRFEMSDRSESIVFHRAELEAATEEILSNEGIRYQASAALRSIWEDDE